MRWSLALLMTFLSPVSVLAGGIEPIGKVGQVDWINGVVSIKAGGVRRAGSIVVGSERYRALYEVLLDLRVSDGMKVRDLVQVDPKLRSKILKIVRSAKMRGIRYLSDSTIELSLEVRIWGKEGVAEALLSSDLKSKMPPLESPEMDRLRALERRIEAIEEFLKSLGYGGALQEEPIPEYTGLVLDLRGTGFKPSIFPRIICEGEELYSLEMVDREILVENGMVMYTDSLDLEKIKDRVGENPLIIDVRRLSPDKTDPIIGSNLKLFKIQSLRDALKRCGVVMVVDR
jgi:hypothetical protein